MWSALRSKLYLIILVVLLAAVTVFVLFSSQSQIGLVNLSPVINDLSQPEVVLNKELTLGKKVAGTTEVIAIPAIPQTTTDVAALIRLEFVYGTVLNVESDLAMLPACKNGQTYSDNLVCADLASPTPIVKDKILLWVTVQWEDQKANKPQIIRLEEDAFYNNVVTTSTNTGNIVTPQNGTAIPFGNEFSQIGLQNNYVSTILIVVWSLILIGVIIFYRKKIFASLAFQSIRVVSLGILILGVIFSGIYISSNDLLPQQSKAYDSVEKNQLVQPVLNLSITMGFGNCGYWCNLYCYGPSGLCHTGIDVGVQQTIYAAGAGKVYSTTSSSTGYGNHVIIEHTSSSGNKFYTLYAHLASIAVNRGDIVNNNTKIGQMGQSGNAFGIHLHFELRRDPTSYTVNTFEDPTSIVQRKRGSVPPNTPDTPSKIFKCGELGCTDNGRTGKEADEVCEGYSPNLEYECKESKNQCQRIKCPLGQVVVPPCDCTLSEPTSAPTPILTVVPTVKPSTNPTALPKTTVIPTIINSIAPTVAEGVICGAMDVNNDGKLNYIDFYAFTRIYQKRCTDMFPNTGCGGKDNNNDKLIDYRDFSSFVSRYEPNVSSCKIY